MICCAGFYSFSVSLVKKIDISGDHATAGCSNLKLKQVGRWVVTSSVVATGVLQLHQLYLSSAGVGVFLSAADAPLTAWLWQKKGKICLLLCRGSNCPLGLTLGKKIWSQYSLFKFPPPRFRH